MHKFAIEARDIWKSYKLGDTKVDALRGLTLELNRREFTALVGASGSGKSTLLNLLGALDHTDKGVISVGGRPLTGLSKVALCELRSRHIGFIFQAFHLIPVLSVQENVALPLHLIRELSDKQHQERVANALAQVGLSDFAQAKPNRLSGGQRQRVAIARALVTGPDIVFADEPTANLDSKTAHAIIDLLQSLNEKSGVTFLMSSHDEKLIGRVSRVIRIQDGVLL